MTLETATSFFGWCTLINVGLLTFWFAFYWLGHSWMYRLHGGLFRLSRDKFDAIHYAGLATYKVGIFLLNLVPYLALSIMNR